MPCVGALPTLPPFRSYAGLLQRIFSRGKEEKVDISQPTNFVHKSHIGFDPNKGFDVSTSLLVCVMSCLLLLRLLTSRLL